MDEEGNRNEVAALRARLEEAEETLRALREGEVDALFIRGPRNEERVYTLTRTERPLRLMIEQMQDGALTVAGAAHLIQYCNPALGELARRPPEEMVGQPVEALLSGAELSDLLASDATWKGELMLCRADGEQVPVRVSSTPIEADDELTHCLLVTDLSTERAYARLKEAERALREADRAKDDFLAMLGHELRNPLAPIRSAVDVMRARHAMASENTLDRCVQTIDRQLTHITRLVDDLLDVARITRGAVRLQTVPVAVQDVVAAAAEAARPLIDERDQRLEIRAPREPLWIQADPARMAQVFANLLDNAAKYSDPARRIVVEVALRGERVEVRVEDEGVGISSHLLPHVFDLFTQAEPTLDRARGGLGLGLHLVKRLVEMHGGNVMAESEGPGRGTRFTVSLPERASVPITAGEAAQARPAPDMRRVLVVDDNCDAAETLAMLLELRGHETRVAFSGVEALQVAADWGPDAICLDLGLPEVDGYEVARRLRARPGGGELLLIALTGYGQAEDRKRTQAAGFDHHCVKPADIEDLEAMLASER